MPKPVEKPRAGTKQENRFRVSFSIEKKVVRVLVMGFSQGFLSGVFRQRSAASRVDLEPKLAHRWFFRQCDNGLESVTVCW